MKKVKLEKEDIQKLANNIRLRIEEDDIEWYKGQLEKVLSYLEVFDEIDTETIEQTSQVTGLKNVFREDVVEPSFGYEQVFLNRKDHDGYFVVNKVI